MASKGRDLGNIVSPKTGIAVTISGDPVVLGVGNTEHLRVTGGGNVGINTTAPNATLTVGPVNEPTFDRGSVAIKAVQDDNSLPTNIYLEELSGAEGWQLSVDSDGDLNFHNSGVASPTVTFADNDNVGFGTENPQAKVDVTGGKLATNVDIDGRVIIKSRQNWNFGTIRIVREASNTSDAKLISFMLEGDSDSETNLYKYPNIILRTDSAAGAGSISTTLNAALELTAPHSIRFGVNDGEAARFNSSGNLVFPSGQGIDFSATADGSGTVRSEILDDYEEGQWTPSITFGSGNTGITYSEQQGQYRKIGKMVFCTVLVTMTAKGTSTGTMEINGLPFACSDANPTDGGRIAGSLTFFNGFSSLNSIPAIYGIHDATKCRLVQLNDHDGTGTDENPLTNTNASNSTQFRASLSYPSD